jgi:RHS repeat-associated protein
MNGTSDWENGKLLTAVRHNRHDATLGNVQITETYVYGGRQGRVSARTTASSNGPWFTQSFAWNEMGQQATVTYPNCIFSPCNGAPGPSRTVTNNYTNGWLTSVTGFTNTITYHPNGLVNQIPHVNGMTVTQANDPNAMMRPASITATVGAATPWGSGTYTYDGVGNVKSIGANYYRYDRVSRLTEGTAEYVSGSNHKRQTYAYDTYGNLKTITTIVDGLVTNTQTLAPSPSTNRLTNAGTTYDESGNLTAWPTWSYTHDGLDMMLTHNNGSKTYRFLYTADDERVATFDATLNRWAWRLRGLDNKVLREYRNQGGIWSWQKDWIHRGGALLATDQPSIGIRHFALDHLGTPRLITSSTGATVATHNYYPFGEEATSETQDAEVMKFTGHERDTEFTNSKNSMDYMHARLYLPVLGRFLSVDPLGGYATSPQSWNNYTYVLNRPISFSDPSGMCAAVTLDGICTESITVTAVDPLREARESAENANALREAEFLAQSRQGEERFLGYSPLMREWNTSSWGGTWDRFGHFLHSNPEEVLFAAIPLFRISNLRYVKGGRVLRGHVTEKGGVSAARQHFERVTGRPPRGDSDMAKLPDGTFVRFRSSGSGGAKVEINDRNSGTYQKTTFRD